MTYQLRDYKHCIHCIIVYCGYIYNKIENSRKASVLCFVLYKFKYIHRAFVMWRRFQKNSLLLAAALLWNRVGSVVLLLVVWLSIKFSCINNLKFLFFINLPIKVYWKLWTFGEFQLQFFSLHLEKCFYNLNPQ